MTLRSGQLTDLVTFQKKVRTYDGEIEYVTWVNDFKEWVDGERLAEQLSRFTLRYRQGITSDTHRILAFNAVWNITNVLPDARYSQLIIECDWSAMIEVTHLKSPRREWIAGPAAVARPILAAPDNYATQVLACGPNAYWRFDESSTTMAVADATGHRQVGAYQNAPLLGLPGIFGGYGETAITLDGVTQYVAFPDNPFLDPRDTFSLEIWIKPTLAAMGSAGMLFDKGYLGGIGYYLMLNDGMIEFGARDASTSHRYKELAESLAAIEADMWSHIVATKAGPDVHLYVNGADVTVSVQNATISDTASPLTIGASADLDNFFAGALDEAAIYPAALALSTVRSHYQLIAQ